MTATLPLGANLKDPVCSHSSTAARRPSSTRNGAAPAAFWRSRSRRASLALFCASRTRLSALAFELMLMIAEPYDASGAFLYHHPQHHRVPICRHRLCPVPSPANTTQRALRPPLTTAHQYQHFSSTPRTTHLLH